MKEEFIFFILVVWLCAGEQEELRVHTMKNTQIFKSSRLFQLGK
jgi:hypothetical protein